MDNSIVETQEEFKYRLEVVQKDVDFLSKLPVSNLNRCVNNLTIRVTEMRKLKVKILVLYIYIFEKRIYKNEI